MGKRAYIRIKIGWLGGEPGDWYDTNYWVSLSTDTPETLAEPVARWVADNFEQMINDEGDDDDE